MMQETSEKRNAATKLRRAEDARKARRLKNKTKVKGKRAVRARAKTLGLDISQQAGNSDTGLPDVAPKGKEKAPKAKPKNKTTFLQK